MADAQVLPPVEEIREKYFAFKSLNWAEFAPTVGLHPTTSRLDYPTRRWRQEKHQLNLLEKAEQVNHDLVEARMDTFSMSAKLLVQYPKTAEMMLNAIHNEVVRLIADSQAKKIGLPVKQVESLSRALRNVAAVHDIYVFRKLPDVNLLTEQTAPKDVNSVEANRDRVVFKFRNGLELTPTQSRELAETFYDKPAPTPPEPPKPPQPAEKPVGD